MLAELIVENLVLIERVQLQLTPGFNVFTGETGAGKSLLIDALGLLFGARGDGDLIRPGADQAEVSARFVLNDADIVRRLETEVGVLFEAPEDHGGSPSWEMVLSRLLPRQGRARAYANGRPVALAALKHLSEELIDIHGQHQNQSLLRPATRLEVLDRFGEATAERAAVRRAWDAAREAAAELADLRKAARERKGREDLFRFQLKELEDARLDDIEPAALEGDLKLLQGAERIREAALYAGEALDGENGDSAAEFMARALKGLEHLGDAGTEIDELAGRLDGVLSEARELARDLADLAERARSDPERLAELEECRARWRMLERKHGRDLEGLRGLRDTLRKDLADLANLDVRTGEQEAALEKAVTELKSAAAKLSRKRASAARKLERAVAAELGDLGLKGAALKVGLTPHEKDSTREENEIGRLMPSGMRATGTEGAEVLFSANPDLPPRPLADVASGGEMSRVMLALKGVLAKAGGADRLPVVVFDEVDSGVGGRVGEVLGRKMAALGRVRQVLCVTHLPQVAAFAHLQLKVEKSRTSSTTKARGASGTTAVTVAILDDKQRVEELALMLRGDSVTQHTREEAAEMLRAAQGGSPVRRKSTARKGK